MQGSWANEGCKGLYKLLPGLEEEFVREKPTPEPVAINLQCRFGTKALNSEP